ncbi:MFS sugar transporter [Aspergillus luchuensis]|uniref:MFS sugar transporter n=1 Tax=Aspergillus kawachii TaxID=1069201 RepID=A0A146G279_ASPKA|nr:MFS sugar transporter [Aspergillus luchuensis]
MLIAPIGTLTIDKAGRRKLLLIAFGGMDICMAVMAGCISQPSNTTAVHTAPVSAARDMRKHGRLQGAHGGLQVEEKATEEHMEVV